MAKIDNNLEIIEKTTKKTIEINEKLQIIEKLQILYA